MNPVSRNETVSNVWNLTTREIEILRLKSVGSTLEDIASELSASLQEVESLTTALVAKLGVTSIEAVVELAVEHDLILPHDEEELDRLELEFLRMLARGLPNQRASDGLFIDLGPIRPDRKAS